MSVLLLSATRFRPLKSLRARVGADVQAGQQRGIRASPVILVNGKRIDGVPSLAVLAQYVEEALAPQPVEQAHKP